jgi:restriction system protein
MDITYHYPPELFNLMIDTIPRLCRSKKNLLLFFRGAGIKRSDLADLEAQVDRDKDSINKFQITRIILQRLNERGEPALRERRELLRRVVEFEDFSACWPSDEFEAKGLVAEIRRIVNVKDSFTMACSPETSPAEMLESPEPKEIRDEEEAVYGRAGHRDFAASGAG